MKSIRKIRQKRGFDCVNRLSTAIALMLALAVVAYSPESSAYTVSPVKPAQPEQSEQTIQGVARGYL